MLPNALQRLLFSITAAARSSVPAGPCGRELRPRCEWPSRFRPGGCLRRNTSQSVLQSGLASHGGPAYSERPAAALPSDIRCASGPAPTCHAKAGRGTGHARPYTLLPLAVSAIACLPRYLRDALPYLAARYLPVLPLSWSPLTNSTMPSRSMSATSKETCAGCQCRFVSPGVYSAVIRPF